MISKKEVKHIAKLARLGLSEKEMEKMEKELSSILEYFEKLKEVDVSQVEPTFHSVPIENVMREDKINAKRNTQGAKLLYLAPDTKDGYLKVKSIFKDGSN